MSVQTVRAKTNRASSGWSFFGIAFVLAFVYECLSGKQASFLEKIWNAGGDAVGLCIVGFVVIALGGAVYGIGEALLKRLDGKRPEPVQELSANAESGVQPDVAPDEKSSWRFRVACAIVFVLGISGVFIMAHRFAERAEKYDVAKSQCEKAALDAAHQKFGTSLQLTARSIPNILLRDDESAECLVGISGVVPNTEWRFQVHLRGNGPFPDSAEAVE